MIKNENHFGLKGAALSPRAAISYLSRTARAREKAEATGTAVRYLLFASDEHGKHEKNIRATDENEEKEGGKQERRKKKKRQRRKGGGEGERGGGAQCKGEVF